MPRIVEAPSSRAGSVNNKGRKENLDWIISGTTDETIVEALIEGASPVAIGASVLSEIKWKPNGKNHWTGESIYTPPEDDKNQEEPEVGDSSWDFDTTGETMKLAKSLATISSHAAPGDTAPDFQGLIGVSKDGVEGTEVEVQALRFSFKKKLAGATVTTAFVKNLVNASKTVNSTPFMTDFAAGEVFFHGATGREQNGGTWDVHYSFSFSPNLTGLVYGDVVGVSKKGWEHLWIYSVPKKVIGSVVAYVPKFVYVEQVYKTHAWTGIGL